MAVIETKYSVGDVVFHANTTTERKQHPCPDCKGERKWHVMSPAGGEYTTACPRCTTSYLSDHDLSLVYTAHVPWVQRLTIGSVQFNSAGGSWDSGARYMCQETGIGSGTVYCESKLFTTETEALAACEAMAAVANLEQPHIVELRNKTLELSDYQIEHAMIASAKQYKSKINSMFRNIGYLFSTIEEAADKDAILEAIDDYKRFTWQCDKEKFAVLDADQPPTGGGGQLPSPERY